MRKMQNIIKVEVLVIDKTALSTKVAVRRKKPEMSIRKV